MPRRPVRKCHTHASPVIKSQFQDFLPYRQPLTAQSLSVTPVVELGRRSAGKGPVPSRGRTRYHARTGVERALSGTPGQSASGVAQLVIVAWVNWMDGSVSGAPDMFISGLVRHVVGAERRVHASSASPIHARMRVSLHVEVEGKQSA
jgi:hypothetical protein